MRIKLKQPFVENSKTCKKGLSPPFYIYKANEDQAIFRNVKGREVSRLLDRGSKDAQQIKASVSSIIKRVEEEGDRALFELERELDSCELSSLNVSEKEFEEAEQNLDPALKHSIELAIENVTSYQKRLLPPSLWLESFGNGIIAGEKVSAIESVGLYVPRGKGSFPSVMIMLGVPARVAGVKRIVVATPPDRYGKVDEKVLYVCKKLGIKEVYTLPKNIGKGVRNVDFKLALTDETLNYLLALRDIGLLSKEEITVGKSRVRPFDVVLRLVPQPSSLLDLKGVSCVVIEVEGVDKRGKETQAFCRDVSRRGLYQTQSERNVLPYRCWRRGRRLAHA
ncbi:hypothetical protein B9Q10_01870 [Candidatus Marsarchaeota G2 archaeon ECH_B_SAG-E12]|uniref:Uncharacterized protein n=1 Tax=Candidatus Marsarchaeota G2 archaeon ECH_B_SAG-E12 TaxID=1978164 RepID=A0A2R6BTM0_9ARCH|nr:MAG: hypothetical protein B9Q10_01870 [Candidatus Marsarchaeota G2 archaeon ECH_B_SAG-E12]